jgi:transcriptional regulator with XRE-family HTH domain
METGGTNLFGTTIKAARERRGLTGEDLRERAGIHPTSLSFLERGQQAPTFEQIRRLSKVLGLKVERLAALAARSRFVRRGAGRPAGQSSKRSA